jgi:hypothetical protein
VKRKEVTRQREMSNEEREISNEESANSLLFPRELSKKQRRYLR